MAAAELELKSPSIPLFQRGDFSRYGFNPSFGKEGKGRFFNRMSCELCGDLGQDTRKNPACRGHRDFIGNIRQKSPKSNDVVRRVTELRAGDAFRFPG